MALSEAALNLRLVAITYGVLGVNIYRLASLCGEPLPRFEAGAHIDLQISSEIVRQYSLLWPRPAADCYEIAVQAALDGRGGSRAWHHETVVGDIYRVSPPRNHFSLGPATDATSWLFAGGIGITPIISMYRQLRSEGRPVRLHYWTRNPTTALFHAELTTVTDGSVQFHHTEVPAPKLDAILTDAPADAPLYCCGPARMIDAFDAMTEGRKPGLVHRERFAASAAPLAPAGSFVVRLVRSDRDLQVGAGESVLEACLAAGIDLSYSCEEGVCGACEVRVLSGQVDHRDQVLSPAAKAASTTMMACCSRGLTTLELDL